MVMVPPFGVLFRMVYILFAWCVQKVKYEKALEQLVAATLELAMSENLTPI